MTLFKTKNKQMTFEDLKNNYIINLNQRTDLSKDVVENIINKVTKLEDKEYKIVGYGSLLNISDVYRTSPNLISHEVGYIDGWSRIFNMGNTDTGSYLNVYPDEEQTDMIVAILTVPAKDMFNFIEREINYRFVTVNVKDGNNTLHEAIMVLGYSDQVKHNLIPQLNYLHLCMTGVGKLAGKRGVDNFVNSTETCFGSLKYFLGSSLDEVIRRQTYLSR